MIHEVPLVNNQIMWNSNHYPYPVDDNAYEMPSGHGLGSPDTNKLAQGEGAESHNALLNLRETRQTGIQLQTQPNLTEVSDDSCRGTRKF